MSVCDKVCLNDLVVSEGHAAAHTLLQTDISRVTVSLATGLRDQLVGAEEPEETLLKVLRAADAAAVELYGEHGGRKQIIAELGSDGRCRAD